MLYHDYINEVIKKTNLNPADILFYQDLPLENTYDNFFEFCLDNITRFSPNFKTTPTYFFFSNRLDANASASFYNGAYYIQVTQGLIVNLSNRLGRKKNFIQNSDLDDFKELQAGLNDNLDYLMFQSSMIFTFYHEFAHTVQFGNESLSLSENTKNSNFNFERHVMEYDADLNGCQFVGMYIMQYYESLPENIKTEKNYNNLMYLGISSIFITFILFLNKELDGLKPNKDFLEFYTRKNTHPHTLVRLHYILVHYIFNAKNNSALIDKQDTLNNIFKICSRYFNDSNIFNDFVQAFNSNILEINSYDTELYLESLKMKNLIRHKINLFKLE